MNISLQMSKGGIKAHQKAMSNIANNIANVNSEGYKAKSAHFTSLLNNDRTAEDGNFTVNAGVRNAIVGNNFSQGALRHSPSTLQLSVADEGFFQVEDSLGNTYLTRDGTFFKNSSGQLVNSAGDALVYEAILPEQLGLRAVH